MWIKRRNWARADASRWPRPVLDTSGLASRHVRYVLKLRRTLNQNFKLGRALWENRTADNCHRWFDRDSWIFSILLYVLSVSSCPFWELNRISLNVSMGKLIESQRGLTPIYAQRTMLFRASIARPREIDTFPSLACVARVESISVSLMSRPHVRRARRFPVRRGVFRNVFSPISPIIDTISALLS